MEVCKQCCLLLLLVYTIVFWMHKVSYCIIASIADLLLKNTFVNVILHKNINIVAGYVFLFAG